MRAEEFISEGVAGEMSVKDMIAYLRQHHDRNLHPDYLNHLANTNSKFVLKTIPLTALRTELSGLDRTKVEQYKQMDFSKAPPIVIGSDGNILDGYHRATVAKALGIPSIRAYVGMAKQGIEEDTENYNGINILFQKDDDEVFVKASAGGKELGHVLFVDSDGYLMPQDLEVDERFRGQGIAQAMYDYVKSRGYKIRRSSQQTDAGAGFWNKHRAGQNVWEQDLDEVQILSKVKGKGSEPSQLPKFGRPIKPGEEIKYLGRKIADWNGYEIWRDILGGQVAYTLVDPATRQSIVHAFGSRYQRNPRSFVIAGLYASPGNPVRAAEFYRALVTELGLTLISDRKQSPGGQRVWQQLEQFADIEVYGYDTRTGKVQNIGASDEEMYAVPAGAGRDRDSRYTAKNIRLVATKK